jgi:uncharacterized membrane protein
MPDTSNTTARVSQRGSEIPDGASHAALRIGAILNRIVSVFARHWLLAINTVIAVTVALPIVAPVLMVTGHHSTARLIYTLFQPFCHQLPERSFFLFGPQLTYSLQELKRMTGADVPLRYVGNSALGYKVAICQRDVAMYTAMLLAGLAFPLVRHRLRPLPVKVFALLCLPMAFDGFGQLLMLWQSTWWSRIISGAVFGMACVWLAYPYVEAGMNDVRQVMERQRAPETL